MEAAMKLARQYFLELDPPQPSRTKFIARKESYHGTTLGSLSMSGHVGRRALFEPMLMPNISRVSACNAYRGMKPGESVANYVARLAEELDAEFQRVGPEDVCAFVAEPVVGAALGCVPAVEGYLQAVAEVCERHGALLILDEIMSGMGRCGTLHAWQHDGIPPDIQTIGKGLGGGYAPVAGLLIRKRVVEALDKGTGAFAHGQTYQGHPIACTAALEVQRIIREEKLVENVAKMGVLLEQLLRQRLSDHPHVGDIRGRGLFWGVRSGLFCALSSANNPRLNSFEIKIRRHRSIHRKLLQCRFTRKVGCLAEGRAQLTIAGMEEKYSISIYPGSGSVDGTSGDHVLLCPAYTVAQADIELIVDRAATVIEDFFSDMKQAVARGFAY